MYHILVTLWLWHSVLVVHSGAAVGHDGPEHAVRHNVLFVLALGLQLRLRLSKKKQGKTELVCSLYSFYDVYYDIIIKEKGTIT